MRNRDWVLNVAVVTAFIFVGGVVLSVLSIILYVLLKLAGG